MKKLYVVVSIVLVAGCLSACQMPTPPITVSPTQGRSSASASSEMLPAQTPAETPTAQQGNILQQIDALYAQLDTTPLPLLENDRYSLDPNRGLEELPPQLAKDEPDAYMLANQIRNYLYEGGNILQDFNNPQDALSPLMLKTALYRTAPIDYKALEDASNTDHILAELIKRESENGRLPDEIYYRSEVESVFHHLFGEEISAGHMDIEPYCFFQKAGVYTLPRNARAQGWVYPQMTLMEKTADGYVCEAVMVSALEKDTPMETRDGVVLTRENFEQASINSPKYRYTFREEADGRLTLQAFQTLRNPNRENAKG